jgi:hypothetical protein
MFVRGRGTSHELIAASYWNLREGAGAVSIPRAWGIFDHGQEDDVQINLLT